MHGNNNFHNNTHPNLTEHDAYMDIMQPFLVNYYFNDNDEVENSLNYFSFKYFIA